MSTLERIIYMVRRQPYRLEKPIVLQFPVIDICNSQCQMCFIWKNKAEEIVSPTQLRERLKTPLFDRVRAVGINGGEPTLRKDLGELTESLFESLPSLTHISLITNAFKVNEVVERISDVGKVIARHGGTLDVMVSLDGYGAVHDSVRGKPGNFERARTVIDTLRSNKTVTSIRIGCTVIKENVYGIHDLLDFCRREKLYIKYRLGIPHRRLYTEHLDTPYALNREEQTHLVVFLEGLIRHYESNYLQILFYRSLVDQIIHGAPRKAGCDWRHRGATLTSRGKILYCAVQSDPVADIEDENPATEYFRAVGHLEWIRNTKCADCKHDYVGLPSRMNQLRAGAELLLAKAGARKKAQALIERSGVRYAVSMYRFVRTSRHLRAIRPSPTSLGADSRRPIIICGWYGTETLGDKAILGSVVTGIRAVYPLHPIVIASLHPYITEITKTQMHELSDVKVLGVEEAVSSAFNCEMVILGGGPLMAIDELLCVRQLFVAAARAGRPRVVAGCGVGPEGGRRYAKAIGEILNLADVRIFRDCASRDRAIALGVAAELDHVAEDPAFSWVMANANRSESVVVRSQGPQLALGLRAFPWRQYAPQLGERGGLKAQDQTNNGILTALEGLVEQLPNLLIRPIPMCTNHYGDDDRWYYRRIFESRPELATRIDWNLLGRELTPLTYLRAFLEADAALTMRFHSLVFALASGTPSVVIDYTMGRGKVSTLAQASKTTRHIVGEVDPDSLRSDLLVCLNGRLTNHWPKQTRFPALFSGSLIRLRDQLQSKSAKTRDENYPP